MFSLESLTIKHHEVVLSFNPIPELLKMLCHENSIFQKSQCLLQLITIQAKLWVECHCQQSMLIIEHHAFVLLFGLILQHLKVSYHDCLKEKQWKLSVNHQIFGTTEDNFVNIVKVKTADLEFSNRTEIVTVVATNKVVIFPSTVFCASYLKDTYVKKCFFSSWKKKLHSPLIFPADNFVRSDFGIRLGEAENEWENIREMSLFQV